MTYSRNPAVSWTTFDDDIILLNEETGSYVGLNETAAFIWEQLQEPVSSSELQDRLQDTFDTADHNIALDVEQVLAQLTEQGVLLKL